jgi:hypothetical protein
VARAFDVVAAPVVGESLFAHALHLAGSLVGPPVARAGDEAGRDLDLLAGVAREVFIELPGRPAPVPLQRRLEAVALERLGVYRELLAGQPAAGGDRLG